MYRWMMSSFLKNLVDATVKMQIIITMIDNYNPVGQMCMCVCVHVRVKL